MNHIPRSLTALRRTLLALALCLLALAAGAQSAYQLVEQHRQWMRDHYPKAGKLSEEQRLREASFAVINELREPEAMALLHAVGHQVPAVETYAAMKESGEHDHRFTHTLRALEDLYHYAEQRLGRDNPTTGWCKYLWLDCLNNMQDISQRIGAVIAEQQDVAQRTGDKENKALNCLFRILRFDASVRQDLCNSPRLYDDVLKVERDVLKLYPPKTSNPSHAKAVLYTKLAKARTGFSASREATAAYNEVGLNSETPYVKNTNTGVVTNAEYLFHVAEECYTQLYTPGHPEVQEFYVCLEDARLTYGTYNDEHLDVLKAHYDYASLYYGDGSLPQLMRKINYWNLLSALGQEIPDAFMWRSMLGELKGYMGEGNLYYAFWARNIVDIVSIQLPLQLADAARLYDEGVAHICGSDSLRAAYLRYMLYSDFKDMAPALFEANVPKVAEYYTAHHDTTMLSIAFGRQLAVDHYVGLNNHEAGYRYQTMVTEDVRQRYGTSSTVYLDEKEQELNLLASCNPDAARRQYPDLISKMKAAQADHTYALTDYATLEHNNRHYQRAADLMQQAFDESSAEGDTHRRANMLLGKLVSLSFLNGTEKEQQQLYRQAKRILDTDTDTLAWMPVNFYIAANYLKSTGQYQEALDMYNQGINHCDHIDTGFNTDYIDLVTGRYDLYVNGLHDMTTAYRLIEQDMAAFDNRAFNYYTTDQLDYLWAVYNLTAKNSEEVFTVFSYFMRITQATFSIFSQAGGNVAQMARYMVRLYAEFIDLYAFYDDWSKRIDLRSLSAEQRNLMDTYKSQFNDVVKALSDIMEQMGLSATSPIPVSVDEEVFYAFLSAQEKFYSTIRPDEQKVREVMDRHMGLTREANPSEFVNVCLYRMNFLNGKGLYGETKTFYEKQMKPYAEAHKLADAVRLPVASLMAATCQALGDARSMLPFARTYYKEVKDIMAHNYPLLTEQEQNNMAKRFGDPSFWLSATLATYPDKSKISGEVYDAVLYRTGLQLRSQRETRDAIMRSGDKELMALVDSLNRLRGEMERTQGYKPTLSSEEAQRIYPTVAKQQARINALERTIVDRSAPYRSAAPLDATWQQVRDRLHEGEAAIEFIYAHPLWMALVVTPGCAEPQAIPLSVADSLSNALQRLGITNPTTLARKLYNERAIDLYSLLWRPLEPTLKNISRIHYATQGLLSTIAFAAIATPDGHYLADRYDLCPLTTTAQLLHPATERRPKTMVAMGSIYYSDRQRQQVAAGDVTAARGDDDLTFDDFSNADTTVRGERASMRYHFKYLPFTRQEISDLRQAMAGTTMRVAEGSEATEQTLRQQLRQAPDVLHLATHGFFIANSAQAVSMPFFKQRAVSVDDAMQRAGVALADAEDTWTGAASPADDTDGILTASEVASLNLRGTQLVTLSACETALGNYTFEGMFGLPRGFKQAGAASLLVSLWSVNDKSTAMLMTSFYRRWMQGATKREAFRQAVADVRKAYPQPYYWAPFVLLDAAQ